MRAYQKKDHPKGPQVCNLTGRKRKGGLYKTTLSYPWGALRGNKKGEKKTKTTTSETTKVRKRGKVQGEKTKEMKKSSG